MVPISEAIFDPTLPANIRHMIVEENSSNKVSLVTRPVVYVGNKGFDEFNLVCIVIMAPIKTEMMITIGKDCNPNFSNSFGN